MILRSLIRRWDGLLPLIFVVLWALVGLVSLLWTPYALTDTDGYSVWAAPSAAHVLGTDGAGADIATWLMAGSATEFAIVVAVIALTAVLGVGGVALSVAHSARVRSVSVLVIDALISIPTVVIALILAAPAGASVLAVILACSIVYALNLMRVVRPAAAAAARSQYVVYARYKGVSEWRIFVQHILPQVMPSVIITVSHSAATAILAESGLTYLGIGVPAHVASWGQSLATAARFVTLHPATAIWPGLLITVAVIALNILGDAVRECADPLTNPLLRGDRTQEVKN
ncbi:ABC transporter permease [Alloscardovia macacae]|uniref:ABC transporter permease n=1 Tax=Alloscardovia macacae TaxID=1160091 RepID=A0A261F656_9BIFI|nr:ABC transporter permease [Alloscardovia macacae]OZG54610.1 ABC transporter permease [Alloscardovia macacae]